jgi:predicted O-methyltransferase YrrM
MFNLRFAFDFFLHQINANTRHGIHSPFVYRLADEVLYDDSEKKVYAEIEQLRDVLYADDRLINITDLGAGSSINKNNKKRISDIAKNSLKRPKLAQLLYRLVVNQKPKNMIELGTCLGITSMYLQNAAPEAKLFTLEGCIEIAEVAQNVFSKAGRNDIELVLGNFDHTLPIILNQLKRIDFVFVDGNHQKQATINYFEWCLPKVHDGTLLIFDDIYWSQGMKEAWQLIKAHPKVTVTLDLFWIGLVFFRKGQVKEDFMLKI